MNNEIKKYKDIALIEAEKRFINPFNQIKFIDGILFGFTLAIEMLESDEAENFKDEGGSPSDFLRYKLNEEGQTSND